MPLGSGQPGPGGGTRDPDQARIQMRRKQRRPTQCAETQERGLKHFIIPGDEPSMLKESRDKDNFPRHLFGILAVGVSLTYTLIPGQATGGEINRFLRCNILL